MLQACRIISSSKIYQTIPIRCRAYVGYYWVLRNFQHDVFLQTIIDILWTLNPNGINRAYVLNLVADQKHRKCTITLCLGTLRSLVCVTRAHSPIILLLRIILIVGIDPIRLEWGGKPKAKEMYNYNVFGNIAYPCVSRAHLLCYKHGYRNFIDVAMHG